MNSLDSDILFVLGGIILLAMMAGCGICIWIARGEPDSNGDPERDAGYTDREIAERSRTWDRGSAATELRPNLSYARRLNRAALRRAAGH